MGMLRISPSLTPVGFCWSLLSIVTAGAIGVCYYMPYWLVDGHMCIHEQSQTGSEMSLAVLHKEQFCSIVHFGPFRRCGYPRPSAYGFDIMTDLCGRYRLFDSIPSIWWKCSTILVGLGAGAALVVAIVSLPSMCISNIITDVTGKWFGAAQAFAGFCVASGAICFPVGWDNQEVKECCGLDTTILALGFRKEQPSGTCKVGWAFWGVVGGALVLFVCAGLSTVAGQPLVDPTKNKHGKKSPTMNGDTVYFTAAQPNVTECLVVETRRSSTGTENTALLKTISV